MENKKSKKDWKNALLSSGLPLEHVVAGIIEKQKIYSYGEYTYMRTNGKGDQSEHSVDIDSVISGKSSLFYFLIECKYCYQSVKWLFTPISKGNKELISLDYELIKSLDELCPIRVDSSKFAKFEANLNLCSKGIEIHQSNKNESAIRHGLSQLSYALPNKALYILENQLAARNDENLWIEFLIPILVTTADLFILNRGTDIKVIQKATEINSIATAVNALIIYKEPTIDLEKYSENIFKKNIEVNPLFLSRLKELNGLFDEYTNEKNFLHWNLSSKFRRLSSKILVVKFDALEEIIKKLLTAFKTAMKNYHKFAVLKNNWEEHKSFSDTKTWFEKYTPADTKVQ